MSKDATVRSMRKISARSRRARPDIEAASRSEVIREFDRAEPTPPTKEIQLMTEEERKIFPPPEWRRLAFAIEFGSPQIVTFCGFNPARTTRSPWIGFCFAKITLHQSHYSCIQASRA